MMRRKLIPMLWDDYQDAAIAISVPVDGPYGVAATQLWAPGAAVGQIGPPPLGGGLLWTPGAKIGELCPA